MKSVFNKIEKEKSKEIEFPVLVEALVDGEAVVVLLVSDGTGVVVKGNKYNPIGSFSNSFVSTTDKTRWRILSPEESVVLSND